ncbi:MAG: hypothetical protein AAFY56_22325 [Pseudomonadota bacterium]
MTKKSASFVIAFLLLAAIPVVHIVQQKSDRSSFEEIDRGDSKKEIVDVMGQPDEVRSCPDTLFWGGDHKRLGPNNGQCVEEFYYSSTPGGWSVGFSDEGQAVHKYEYVSP